MEDREGLSDIVHGILGFVYIFTGILGLSGNGLLAHRLWTKSPFTVIRRNTLHISFAFANAGIVCGFPLTAPSCFANRWLFGEFGCQFYGFIGMMFGITCIYHLMFMTIDLYVHREGHIAAQKKMYYTAQCILSWFGGVFWAIMPLLGWSSYSLEPSGHSCTIDWQDDHVGYAVYLLCISTVCYSIPFSIILYCLLVTAVKSNKKVVHSDSADEIADQQKQQQSTVVEKPQHKITKVVAGISLLTLIGFAPYAILCIYPLFDNPDQVPILLSSLPPIILKLAMCITSWIYLVSIYPGCGLSGCGRGPSSLGLSMTVSGHARTD